MSIIFIILGLINAIYLQSVHNSSSLTCAAGSGCTDVLASSYSSFLGVPLASFGIGLFLVLLTIYGLSKKGQLSSSTSTSLNLLLLTPAAAIGLILLAVQLFYIDAFCLFCTFNTVLLLILFGLAYKQYLNEKSLNFDVNLTQVIAIVAVFLLPVFYGTNQSSNNNDVYMIGEIAGEMVSVNQIGNSDFEPKWMKVKQKEYAVKKEFFEYKLLELAAKRQGLSIRGFIDKEIIPTIKITDQQIRDFYEDKKADLPKDKTYEQIKSSIKKFLVRKEETFAIRDYIKTLYDEYDAKLMIKKSTPKKMVANPFRSYSIGDPNAPVKIVEYSDLECGYCKRAFVEIKDLIRKFDGRVYFEYRHFPLDFHPFSKQFSMASVCAGEQDKFFDFIEISFANQKDFSKILPVALAEKLGLNIDEFNQCLKSDLPLRVVNRDISDGNRLDVTATPTFYINGHLFNGIPNEDDIMSYL
ncbi:MAG: vitamin K epoxide reductase family protein [Candidatus Margulisiibacteriota bacterium]|nr:vitamin K epoxide reductase family protein [Candidatus Margulisiibacteriota bacterium]